MKTPTRRGRWSRSTFERVHGCTRTSTSATTILKACRNCTGSITAKNTRQKAGVNTNHVESFFSRIQRAYIGIHHRFSVRYFDWYAAEIAWREDNRRVDNGLQLRGMLYKAPSRPTSRNLCGYWQGNHPPDLVWEGGENPERQWR
ncbi:transposase [Agrobacterium sp. ICMP 6402]|uniref:transposase n=1 Tax=Agrobacterium TaxID=357 RepID=UPI00352BC151